jgi:hypothetical protein
MPLSSISLHHDESTAPVSRPQLPREPGASAGSLNTAGRFKMLPPIEFFIGMLAGGILAYLVAIMVSSRSEEGRR